MIRILQKVWRRYFVGVHAFVVRNGVEIFSTSKKFQLENYESEKSTTVYN